MASKHFCLKWTKFQTNILSAFESLQNTEDLADVTLTCDGISVKAHKFILSACSPYFRTIFKENPCPHPIVILKDVAYIDLIAIVNFMYHGEVMVSEEQLSSFLHTATILQVAGLMHPIEGTTKQPEIPVKKTKSTIIESPECPIKKVKTSPKLKNLVGNVLPFEETPKGMNQMPDQFEVVEVDRIKIENDADRGEFCADVCANVEVIVGEESETQGSILEAALEVRDKPSSILERSLTSQAISGKLSTLPSLPSVIVDKICVLPDLPKTIFIPRKPPEILLEMEKKIIRSSSQSSSPSAFDKPAEFLSQCTKIEEESCQGMEGMSPEEAAFTVDVQPHHSSQCGNCPHCGKVYSNQSALKYHVRLVHSDLTNMYCCHLCPESFDYREGYKKHMAEMHLIRN